MVTMSSHNTCLLLKSSETPNVACHSHLSLKECRCSREGCWIQRRRSVNAKQNVSCCKPCSSHHACIKSNRNVMSHYMLVPPETNMSRHVQSKPAYV